ncbi:hypothetical protein [Pseudobdellovibrio exovorus]|uniref:Uncharacterized protein n=1 Tax=Pseudobdellovibrio exovorus JSS TaxID=1184267 RepID=M4VAI5_9BACT|nr:hypothetical protein [Pseudobdellovibrio exovorus]AGH96243.1 hypothetical protein A11Q_2027 [Pseudobdellovibrio exovorus JSS]
MKPRSISLISFLIIKLFLLTLNAADYQYQLTPNDSGLSQYRQRLAPICQQMRSDVLPQVQYLQDLRQSLQKIWRYSGNPIYADQIDYLLAQIKKVSAEIESLSRPDWNAEVWDLNLQWSIPREQIFPYEQNFYSIASELRKNFFADNFESEQGLDGRIRIFPKAGAKAIPSQSESKIMRHIAPYQFIKFSMDELYFMGMKNESVRQYFKYYLPSNYDENVKITYKKKATALEICQLLTTLQLAITINHTQLGPDFSQDTWIETMRLYLVVAEKDIL